MRWAALRGLRPTPERVEGFLNISLERPIFVISCPRSGSTVFHESLSLHPRVAWLSSICDRHPRRPALNRRIMRAIDYPLIGGLVRRRYPPSEAYVFWDTYFEGFSRPFRDLRGDDVSQKTKARLRASMSQLSTSKRNRLLAKITGWPRLGFLKEVFPDAKFIHLVRDGRAVANSILGVRWWLGWRGPSSWRFGELTPEEREEWERHSRSFVALAAIEWKKVVGSVEETKSVVDPGNWLEIRYEDLCAGGVESFRQVVSFSGLEWSEGFERALRSLSLKSANDKWKRELSLDQQRILEAVTVDGLRRYGYH